MNAPESCRPLVDVRQLRVTCSCGEKPVDAVNGGSLQVEACQPSPAPADLNCSVPLPRERPRAGAHSCVPQTARAAAS